MEFKTKIKNGFTTNVVQYEYTSPTPHEAFSIYAYDTGIELVGQSPRIKTQKDLDNFAQAIGKAWQKHFQLKGIVQ